jgi:pyruvyl transferase EpsI
LAGTPCVVFSNYNHKVKSTYDWISYLPYIRYADTLDDAVQAITELIQMDECVFDNTPLVPYFDQLKDIILEACGDTDD